MAPNVHHGKRFRDSFSFVLSWGFFSGGDWTKEGADAVGTAAAVTHAHCGTAGGEEASTPPHPDCFGILWLDLLDSKMSPSA